MAAPIKRASFTWSHGRAEIQSLGAMLAPVDFLLPDGRSVSPLHIAPWANETPPPDAPPILQSLRGEWPCVPFGASDLTTLHSRWQRPSVKADTLPHGYGSNAHWKILTTDNNSVEAHIEYPPESNISALERRISGVHTSAKLSLELAIHARIDTRIPIGLHPVFRLPENPGTVQLNPGPYDGVWTYPASTGGTSCFTSGARLNDLTKVPGISEDLIDVTCLPFRGNSENLLLLSGTQGRVELQYLLESYQVVLEWNALDFPCVLLWISNRGRQQAPWSGRHLALGIEPICAAFDLGTEVSTADNPLSREGIKTAISLVGGSVWRTSYTIAVEPL